MPDQTDVLGRRIGAALLDFVVLGVVFVICALLFGETESGDGSASVRLEGASALIFFAITLLYYGLTEAATGQTVGKKLLKIRVVRADDGQRASGGQILGRTLLRIVDALPILYLVGFVAVLATGERRQRLGDLAAGTRVQPA